MLGVQDQEVEARAAEDLGRDVPGEAAPEADLRTAVPQGALQWIR